MRKNMVIKEKYIGYIGSNLCKVTLENDGGWWLVKIGNSVHKQTANELFAVQAFNAI